MENALRVLLNIYSDSALQQLRSIVLYDNTDGNINRAEMNNAIANNGFLGVKLRNNRNLRDILQQVQFGGVNTQSLESVMAHVKEAAQRGRSTGDFLRSPEQGGLQNKTATASNIIANQANTAESYYLRQFSHSLVRHMTTVVRMLQQRLGRFIKVQQPSKEPIVYLKENILGESIPIPIINLSSDQIEKQQRLQNFITTVMNFRGTGDPSWMRVRLDHVIRSMAEDVLRNTVDVNQVVPELSPQEQQQMEQQRLMQQQQQQMALNPPQGQPMQMAA